MILYLYSSDVPDPGPIERFFPGKELKRVEVPSGTLVSEVPGIIDGVFTPEQKRSVIGPIEHLLIASPCVPGAVCLGGFDEGYALDESNAGPFGSSISAMLMQRGHAGQGIAVLSRNLARPRIDEMEPTTLDEAAAYRFLFKLANSTQNQVTVVPSISVLISGMEDGDTVVLAYPGDDADWEDSVHVFSGEESPRRVSSLDLFPLDEYTAGIATA